MTKTTALGRLWGSIIRERRELLKMSQYALADEVGVTQAAVTSWERGVTLPSRRNLQKICSTLGLPQAAFTYTSEVA